MNKISYGVILTRWIDDYNFINEYLKKFKTKKDASKQIEENKQKIFEEEKEYLEGIIALDISINKMQGDDDLGVIHTFAIWE